MLAKRGDVGDTLDIEHPASPTTATRDVSSPEVARRDLPSASGGNGVRTETMTREDAKARCPNLGGATAAGGP